MPELPEVETTLRGIAPFVTGFSITRLIVRDRRLRWPVPDGLEMLVAGCEVKQLYRRSKYLICGAGNGWLILHLGMSGSLRICDPDEPASVHDHVDLVMSNGRCVRFRDPRRFGCLLWTDQPPDQHPLLRDLGPEPLQRGFTGAYLHSRSRGRKSPVKNFIMDAHVVVGVGNIYASEALFHAGIHPRRAAGRISRRRYELLVSAIKQTLRRSIKLGGTTLRDFVNSDGSPGYFEQTLAVYGREGKACRSCGGSIRRITLGQRSSFYCITCQT